MTAKYYAILTTLGAAKLANAMALGTKLEITTMAVGDGGGVLPTPDASQTAIVGEQRRAPINMLSIDPANPGQIIAEQVIPENEGGFWIRTIGLYDKDGTLIAVANCPETYKPQLQEGSGRTQTIRMILIVSNTDAVTLKIDPAVVLATRQYVDSGLAGAQVKNDILTVLAGLPAEKNKVPYFTSNKTAALADLTDYARSLMAKTDGAGVLQHLGLTGWGIGMASLPILASFDWQQVEFFSGQTQLATFNTWVNPPAGVTYSDTTTVSIQTVYVQGNRAIVRLVPNATGSGNRREYIINISGAKGVRAFTVLQNFNNDTSTIIPVANGGTGGTTPESALAGLGLEGGVTANGTWVKLPSGVIIQTGASARVTGQRVITFPVQFPVECTHFNVFTYGNINEQVIWTAAAPSRTAVNAAPVAQITPGPVMGAVGGAVGCLWMAIGR